MIWKTAEQLLCSICLLPKRHFMENYLPIPSFAGLFYTCFCQRLRLLNAHAHLPGPTVLGVDLGDKYEMGNCTPNLEFNYAAKSSACRCHKPVLCLPGKCKKLQGSHKTLLAYRNLVSPPQSVTAHLSGPILIKMKIHGMKGGSFYLFFLTSRQRPSVHLQN